MRFGHFNTLRVAAGREMEMAKHGARQARREREEWWKMGSLKVTMTDVKGTVHHIEKLSAGQSLMEVAKAHGVDGISGDCGGGCACATCHVYVDQAWLPKVGKPDDIESAMLDMVADVAQPNSRLGCQIKLRPDLDGLTVTVAPTSD
jgi:2Fe-2S ferredoxin